MWNDHTLKLVRAVVGPERQRQYGAGFRKRDVRGRAMRPVAASPTRGDRRSNLRRGESDDNIAGRCEPRRSLGRR